MQVKQISIFLENRAGRLEEITKILTDAEINIRALSLADTSDFGILRLIVDKPEHARESLHNAGITVIENNVIAAEIDDKPGGLHKILDILGKANISVEYMYAFFEYRVGKAVIIFRIDAAAKAVKILLDAGISLLRDEDICKM